MRLATGSSVTDDHVLFVTGFPGLRARVLLREVLDAEPETRAIALVHPARRTRAEAIARERFDTNRLRLLFGDPIAIDFGLDARSYDELVQTVTIVQHLYQALDRGVPEAAARAANVGGAREVVELARAGRCLTRVVHHSSVFVSGDRSGVVLEDELRAGQRFRSPVEESLATAEKMLVAAGGAPVTVVRSADVVGDSRTGEIERLSGIYAPLVFLSRSPSGTRLPLPPRSEVPLQVVPVDYLARAARVLARHPDAAGKTVHLVDHKALPARRLLELAAKRFGLELEPGINAAFGRALFNNPGVSLLVKNLRALGDLLAPGVVYDDSNARTLLADSGLGCPPLESYFDVLLTGLAKRLAEPPHKEALPEVESAVD